MTKFTVGDKVRCIDDSDIMGLDPSELTKGKIYTVLGFVCHGSINEEIRILGDKGENITRYAKRFTLEVNEKALTNKEKHVKLALAFYETMGIVKGCKVKVINKVKDYSNGWALPWDDAMDQFLNKDFIVNKVDSSDGTLGLSNGYDTRWFPFMAVEFVSAPVPLPEDISISDEYEVKFNEDKSISVGCQTIPFALLETIYNTAKGIK